MSDFKNFNCGLKIISASNNAVFFGKNSAEILKEEFKGFSAGEGDDLKYKFIAEIPSDCTLISKEYISKLLTDMEKTSRKCISAGKIKIYDTKSTNTAPVAVKADKIYNTSCDSARNIITITEILQKRITDKHIDGGILILNPISTYIDFDVVIDSGVTIYQNNMISGKTIIKSGCILMPNNNINSSEIHENVTISASTLNEANVGKNTTVGPNAYLRPHAQIGENCRIGDFVEIKNAKIGSRTKVSHLSYVGDATVGEDCNIGCGVVFVNYNGKTKNKSVVGNKSFIGSNCNIIAPVTIGDGVFVAAGTTVSKNLPTDAFCIGRVREEIKENLAKKYLG